MYHAFLWLLAIELLGLVVFPLAYLLFCRLPDRGLILAKPLSLLFVSYTLWVLGLTHIAPNSQYTIIGILVPLTIASSLVLRAKMPEIAGFLRRERVALITGELVFLGIFFLWLTVVSFAPAIEQTEKPMDFAFLNAILRSEYFPPEDPWLAGHSISYYYFGHFMMATLTKLTSIPSSVSYNLSIALIPALIAGGAFSLVYNLIRLSGASLRPAVLFALAAPVFILLIGNLEGVLEFIHARDLASTGFWEWVSIKGLEGSEGTYAYIFPQEGSWWWRATRVIDTVVEGVSRDYTISEFPFFSFMLGDLHAHVSALPFMILNLALGLNLLVSNEKLGLSWLRHNAGEVVVIALSLGVLAFINIWDFPVFVTVLAVLVLVKGYGDWDGRAEALLGHAVVFLVPILLLAVVAYIPFYLDLGSQASGILPLGDVSTRPFFFFLIWGLLAVVSGSFLLVQMGSIPGLGTRAPGALALTAIVTLLPFVVWAAWQLLALWTGWDILVKHFHGGVIGGEGAVAARFARLLPGLAIVAIATYTMLLRVRSGGERATAFALLPLGLAFYLLIGAELFYLADLFGNRMNTVFKFYYQAWLFLAISSAYGLYYLCSHPVPWSRLLPFSQTPTGTVEPPRPLGRLLRYGWLGVVGILVVASMYYTVGAALDRQRNSGGGSFDGLHFVRERSTGEYEAIMWLRDEAPWGRITEAVGDDYSEYGRISASTGLPTILGWKGHEHQWRGSTRLFQGREEQVSSVYSSDDPDLVQQILRTYEIRYVYVGARERASYGEGKFAKFSSFLKPVFQMGDVVIYELTGGAAQDIAERNSAGTG